MKTLRTVTDLARSYDAILGHDAEDPFCAQRLGDPVSATLDSGIAEMRIAAAGGYFLQGMMPEAERALRQVREALRVTDEVELPEAARARAAAYVITTAEGGALHLDRLRARPADFDPDVRDRLIAGAMVPDADGKEVSFERLLLPFGSADSVEQIVGSYKAISIEGGRSAI